MNIIFIICTIVFSVSAVFYVGFLCGRTYEKTCLELEVEDLNLRHKMEKCLYEKPEYIIEEHDK